MGYHVRRVRIDEWREFKVLRMEALKDSPMAFLERYDVSVEQPDEYWRERVVKGATSPGYAVFVAADDDGTLVGKAGCRLHEEPPGSVTAEIIGVYATPTRRGGDDPPAVRVVTEAVRWAREEARADRVRLFVTEGNDRAAAFYRRLGFVPTGHSVPYDPDPAYRELEWEYRPAAVQSQG